MRFDKYIWTEIKYLFRLGEFSKKRIREALKKRRLENPCSMMRKTIHLRNDSN